MRQSNAMARKVTALLLAVVGLAGRVAALDTRGHILEKLGKRKEAIEDFRRALAKDPTLPESIAALKRLRVKQ